MYGMSLVIGHYVIKLRYILKVENINNFYKYNNKIRFINIFDKYIILFFKIILNK